MQMSNSPTELNRRHFLKTSVGATAAVVTSTWASVAAANETREPRKMIGIQAGPVSFVDEGVEPALDLFQEKGAANAIFLTTFTYGRGLSGRQVPGQPFPDHGKQESDEAFFHGGNYATPHPEFYQNTVLKQTRAPDHGELDIVAAVLPAARKRGMKLFCSIEDAWRADVPGVSEVTQVDLYGKRATSALCPLHPDVRAFWNGLAADLCKSYDIDGLLFFNEHNGPLLEALGAGHAQKIASSRTTCFCEHHQKAAREHGLSFERACEGYVKLDKYVQNALADRRPSDGYFVEFFRLLGEYPEISAWDRLFDESKHAVLASVYATVKSIRPELQVGFHIEHVNSFNPIFRATRRYGDLATKADFLKIVVYNNCGGERYASFIRNVGATVFRDVPKDELLRFNNHLLNYGDEAGLDRLAAAGLSSNYVFRETRRAIAGVQGRCRILPGIDIGIPVSHDSRRATPDDTYAATAAGLKAGADGILYSRKYSEMHLANLAAAGRAVLEDKR
jgi:hypothetical protein